MFLRSCASVFRQCVKTSPRPLLSRVIHTSRLYRSSDEENDLSVDYSKSVTIVLECPNGSIRKEKAYVNETLYGLITRIDPEEKDVPGFGMCKGATTCATCHVFMEEKYFKLNPLEDNEEDLLVDLEQVSDFSRLGCCVRIKEEMDGMVVKFPSVFASVSDKGEDGNGS